MKVYFSASVSAMVYNERNDKKIVDVLNKLIGENNVYSEHIFKNSAEDKFKKLGLSWPEIRKGAYEEIMKQIRLADLMVAEISYQSTSIGHEISYALNNNKQVVLLYLQGKLPRLLQGIRDPNLRTYEYSLDNIEEILKGIVVEAKKKILKRFNFFIPKNLLAHLDEVSMNRGLNKSEYIRKLIERDMKSNKKFVDLVTKKK